MRDQNLIAEPPKFPIKSLDERIADAQSEITAVATADRVSAQGSGPQYDYASTERIVAECRLVLTKHGLSVSRKSAEVLCKDTPLPPTRQGNSPRSWAMVRTTFVVSCTHPWVDLPGYSREYVYELPAIEGGGKSLDKAVLGCTTSALGYFLVGLLLVPRLDENEISAYQEREEATKPIGQVAAEGIRKAAADAGIDMANVIVGMRRKHPNANLGDDIAEWPRSMAAEISAGIERRRNQPSPPVQTPPQQAAKPAARPQQGRAAPQQADRSPASRDAAPAAAGPAEDHGDY